MDTMKFLLGATVVLLFGAIVVSWQGMKTGVQHASPDEIARLSQQIAELTEQIKHQPAPVVVPQVVQQEDSAAIKAKMDAANAESAKLQEAQKKALENKLAVDEEGLIAQKLVESKDSELRRARVIAQALLIGRVRECVEDKQVGEFITIEVLMPEQVQVGSILGVRRKTGILAQYKVSEVAPEGAIANPLPGFGSVKPVPGDELIFPPQY